MPEHKGSVVAQSQYGIKFSENGPWFNWAKGEKQGKPFDDVDKGDSVRMEYDTWDKKDGSKGYTVYVIENLSRSQGVPDDPFPQEDGPFPPEEAPDATGEPVAPAIDKDHLIVRQACIKAACEALAISPLDSEEKTGRITYLAGVFEDWCWR
jgi:hypothetical protein